MATDERFVLVPYAGLNPTYENVREVGIQSLDANIILASGLSTAGSVQSVYYCKVGGAVMYICQYTITAYPMRIFGAFASTGGMYGSSVINSKLDVTANISVHYMKTTSTAYCPYGYTDLTGFNTELEAATAFLSLFPDDYVNIQYVGNGCSIGGTPYAEIGTGIVVPVTLPIGASLTADNISVTKNGASLDFTYNTQTQQIAFTAI